MSLTKKEREKLLKTIEIASGGEISTNEANQMTEKVIGIEKLIHIAEQCYKEGVKSSLFKIPLQYKLTGTLKANYKVLSERKPIQIRDIKVVFAEMIREISCDFGKNDTCNPIFDSHIRLLLTMLVNVADVGIHDGYEIIESMWEKIFTNEDLGLSVELNTTIYSGYTKTMFVLNNDSIRKGQLICEQDFKEIVEYLITLYRDLHNENVISKLDQLSIDDLVWEDFKTYIKCIDGDFSSLTRAYIEEIIDALEAKHIVEAMSIENKVNRLNKCINNYYNTPLDGFDSYINRIVTY